MLKWYQVYQVYYRWSALHVTVDSFALTLSDLLFDALNLINYRSNLSR